MASVTRSEGYYIVLISVHGLIRGENLELGRDADTGGQVKYVVELARALGEHPDVDRVDLLTRRVVDPKVAPDYAEPEESLGPKARIVRLDAGPRRYLRKEVLWPHLGAFVDSVLQHIRRVGRLPTLIHGHYADAGYVTSRVAQLLGTPMAHTGHSLGRVKRERLRANGMRPEAIESQYNIGQRIEAEEVALGNAAFVVASTRQEVEEQYSQYENYHPQQMVIIPPGTDLSRYRPPESSEPFPPYFAALERFLKRPRKPMILALSRADRRKNIGTLVRAYGAHPELQEQANLVVVAGNRDDLQQLDRGAREVLQELLYLIDRDDLYGKVAYPKHHDGADVPDIYRLAAKTGGVFVNPALTEPFGLTLIEAAASGLPVIATEDGGPRDILAVCRNGLLIDPLDERGMAQAIHRALSDRRRWRQWARNGVRGAHEHFSWHSHVAAYLDQVRRVTAGRPRSRLFAVSENRLPYIDRLVVCGLDNVLLGDPEGLQALLTCLKRGGNRMGFAVTTGRSLKATLDALRQWHVPDPDILITAAGGEIHYSHRMLKDTGWTRHIDYRWHPQALQDALREVPGLRLQPPESQEEFKISYFIETGFPGRRALRAHLRKRDLHARLVTSYDTFLDVLPLRASKGLALRYLALRWGMPLEHFMVAGDSGGDEEMLGGAMLSVVVANHDAELTRLRNRSRIYFAEQPHAWGVIEGIEHYRFLENIQVPGEEDMDDHADANGAAP